MEGFDPNTKAVLEELATQNEIMIGALSMRADERLDAGDFDELARIAAQGQIATDRAKFLRQLLDGSLIQEIENDQKALAPYLAEYRKLQSAPHGDENNRAGVDVKVAVISTDPDIADKIKSEFESASSGDGYPLDGQTSSSGRSSKSATSTMPVD